MKKIKLPSIDAVTKGLKTVSEITLGQNKDGRPRSIVDAKLALDKSRRKEQKRREKRFKRMFG